MSARTIMEIVGYVVPFIVAVFFFRLSFLFFQKEKYPTSSLFGVIAACFFLSGFGWFQGLAKTWIVSNVNSRLRAIGEQVNEVQQATMDMHEQLTRHQKEIEGQQRELDKVQGTIRAAQSNIFDAECEITNQYAEIRFVQARISASQTNIDEQAKKLGNVEELVTTLYSATFDESFLGSNTNHVAIRDYGSLKRLWFRLSHCPVPYSVNAIMSGPGGQVPLLPKMFVKNNIVSAAFNGPSECRDLTFHFRYIKDLQNTTLVKTIEMRGTNMLCIDGDCVPVD